MTSYHNIPIICDDASCKEMIHSKSEVRFWRKTLQDAWAITVKLQYGIGAILIASIAGQMTSQTPAQQIYAGMIAKWAGVSLVANVMGIIVLYIYKRSSIHKMLTSPLRPWAWRRANGSSLWRYSFKTLGHMAIAFPIVLGLIWPVAFPVLLGGYVLRETENISRSIACEQQAIIRLTGNSYSTKGLACD